MNLIKYSLFIFSITFVSNSCSNDTIPNDNLNYIGDRISFSVPITAKMRSDASKSVCLPAKTPLRVLANPDKSTNKGPIVQPIGNRLTRDLTCEGQPLNRDLALSIEYSDFTDIPPDRYGLTYGALLVPYKYHFKGSKNFSSNSSVGPFIGYRIDKNEISLELKIVGFAGATTIDKTSVVDGENKTENIAAFSYGIGFIGELKNEFQIGVVFGKDKVGNDTEYEDSDKLWGALAIGYSFAN